MLHPRLADGQTIDEQLRGWARAKGLKLVALCQRWRITERNKRILLSYYY